MSSGSTQTARGRPAPPVNTVLPVVSGTLEDGGTLTATTGDWDGTAPIDFAYQWRRCDPDGSGCVDIPGATGSTYDLTAADVRHAIARRRHRHNDAGEATASSLPSADVARRPARRRRRSRGHRHAASTARR